MLISSRRRNAWINGGGSAMALVLATRVATLKTRPSWHQRNNIGAGGE